jgi:putative membrane protein
VVSYTILFEIFHHYFINIDVEIPIAIPAIIGTISLLLALSPTRLMIAGGS